MPLPELFCETLRREWGSEEAEALFEALDTPSPTAVRLHPLRGEEFPDSEPVPWSLRGRYLKERPSFTLDPAFHAGAYYVQEASSQFVERLLAGEQMEGARLLDLCAAPGGKTTLYASLVGTEGLVVANEVDRRRLQILQDNVRKWGLGNVAVTTADASRFERLGEWFDVVAVDAPCSGEGMFRRLKESREEWSEGGVAQCSAIQREILRSAWQVLKPGGVLIYSTCTFNRMEDEGTLEDFLCWAEGEELVSMPSIAEAEAWGVVTGEVGPFRTYRFFPHRAKGEGFFAAVVRKGGEPTSHSMRKGSKGSRGRSVIQPADPRERGELQRWVMEPERLRFYRAGEVLYACNKESYEAVEWLSEQLTVVYAGVAMGEIFKGSLKPDQALAHFVGMRPEALPTAELTEEAALTYLRKGELRPEWFAEGLNRVTCRGLSLGFAKRIGNRVNNLYPNALRIMNK